MPMRPADIRAELVRRDRSAASVARELGLSKVHVGQVLVGKRRSPRVEEALAAAIEMPVDEVFEPAPNGAAA
jgi:lambda repressor-like predicted transcriptional regulator